MAPNDRGSHASPADELILAGLIAVSVLILQSFLRDSVTNPSAQRAVIAFAVAIPLLGVSALANAMRNWPEEDDPWWLNAALVVALLSTAVALYFTFEYLVPDAALAFTYSGAVAVVVGAAIFGRVRHFRGSKASADDGESRPPSE